MRRRSNPNLTLDFKPNPDLVRHNVTVTDESRFYENDSSAKVYAAPPNNELKSFWETAAHLP